MGMDAANAVVKNLENLMAELYSYAVLTKSRLEEKDRVECGGCPSVSRR